jgi:DNA-binding MarR family transcriptional regulator
MVDIVNHFRIKRISMSDYKSLESLFNLVHVLKRQLHDQIEQLDLGMAPMHVRVMKIIDKKKPCTAIDIASFLDRDKAQVTRLVSTLIENGLITKAPNPNDKRSHYLSITDTGMDIIKTISKVDTETRQIMMEDLSPEEITEFQRIADIMAKNLRSRRT